MIRGIDSWALISLLLAALLLAPLLAVCSGVLSAGPEWTHIADTVLPGYLINTLILITGVSVFSLLFAVPTAWFISTYEFTGRGVWQWALVLPLAVPTFAAAFTHYDILSWSIPIILGVREAWGFEASQIAERILRYGVLILLLSSVLYPYLYFCLRTSFSRQQPAYFEAARMLGKSTRSIFWRVSLALARPSMAAGLSLIIMEVINDYGAVNFFGVPTLTEGIFRTWFGLSDQSSGIRLAVIVVVIVFIVLSLEAWQRRRLRYTEGSLTAMKHQRARLNIRGSILANLLCLIPFSIGFLFPVGRLIHWSLLSRHGFDFAAFFQQVGSSLFLAIGTALVLSFLAFFLAFNAHTTKSKIAIRITRAATLGYAIPSVVTGVGVMVLLGKLDLLSSNLSGAQLVLSGSLCAISFAYAIRFLTVAYRPAYAGIESVCASLHEASTLLGKGKLSSFFRIHFPLLKLNLLAASALVFIDIMKELPLTLVLRPSNFETLATFAFGFAKVGEIYDCAFPCLLIIALSACGLFLINRWSEQLQA
ncbi:MAG: ABC transporter permease [Lentimonas sp.]